ncbi:MAG TPA: hypothetical protein VNM24_15470 [Burkholderiales bacterium]|jgi:hypothetical protein|nr:hypothetical protein [Burkholderiales bacterium]
MRRFCWLALIAIAGCGAPPRGAETGLAQRVHVAGEVRVELNGNAAIYRGELTEGGLQALKKLTAGRSVDTLIVDSAGGEIVAGMDVGDFVLERQLDVTVDGVCLSSCANYVFPAGRRKTILPGSVVAWHGSAKQPGLLDELHAISERAIKARKLPAGREAEELVRARQVNVDYLTGAIFRQEAFFDRIDVDEYITRIGNEIYGVAGFYYLSVEDMARFGIREVSAPEDYARMDLEALEKRTGYRVKYLKLP